MTTTNQTNPAAQVAKDLVAKMGKTAAHEMVMQFHTETPAEHWVEILKAIAEL